MGKVDNLRIFENLEVKKVKFFEPVSVKKVIKNFQPLSLSYTYTYTNKNIHFMLKVANPWHTAYSIKDVRFFSINYSYIAFAYINTRYTLNVHVYSVPIESPCRVLLRVVLNFFKDYARFWKVITLRTDLRPEEIKSLRFTRFLDFIFILFFLLLFFVFIPCAIETIARDLEKRNRVLGVWVRDFMHALMRRWAIKRSSWISFVRWIS